MLGGGTSPAASLAFSPDYQLTGGDRLVNVLSAKSVCFRVQTRFYEVLPENWKVATSWPDKCSILRWGARSTQATAGPASTFASTANGTGTVRPPRWSASGSRARLTLGRSGPRSVRIALPRESHFHSNVAAAVVDAERGPQVLLNVEVGGTVEWDLGDFRLLDPIDFPMPDFVAVGRMADQVQRSTP